MVENKVTKAYDKWFEEDVVDTFNKFPSPKPNMKLKKSNVKIVHRGF